MKRAQKLRQDLDHLTPMERSMLRIATERQQNRPWLGRDGSPGTWQRRHRKQRRRHGS